ncbi:MAG: rhomboid family intramembrane serine protease [Akkermansiaceae bacterium]|nr:rhomboid family intramembrane serine protease [Akkermansiaceae bacterium]NJR42592.1 rhomboid family intramembrane serine protease [Akkermansiaceae bacterium]
MMPTRVPLNNAVGNLRQIWHSPASLIFTAVILVIQLWVTLVGGFNQQPAWSWFGTFGLTREGFLSGKVWQLITYAFLHGDWIHTGLNALFVLLIGSRIEHISGRGLFLKTIIGGLVGGALLHLVFAVSGEGATLLVGLSGGGMALLLLLTTLSPESRMMPLPVSGKNLGIGILAAELILMLANPALGISGFSNLGKILVQHGMGSLFQIGHACHFGGGLVGWIMGRWILRPRITKKRLRRERERQEAREIKRDV